MPKALPSSVTFVDTETTGLATDDRVVSLGAIRLQTAGLEFGRFDVQVLHLVFDPGRKSHPRAEDVHGWNDWQLRHQDTWSQHDRSIQDIMASDLVVAHNFDFDSRFIASEFELAGFDFDWPETFCTMRELRSRGRRASLDGAISDLGLTRAGERHGALEDAYLAMMVYLALNGRQRLRPDPGQFQITPTNFRPVPALLNRTTPSRSSYAARAELWKSIGPLLVILSSIQTADDTALPDVSAAMMDVADREARNLGQAPTRQSLRQLVEAACAARYDDADVRQALRWYSGTRREALSAAIDAFVRFDGTVEEAEIAGLRRLVALA